MALKGDLKSLTLSTVLQILSSESKTGILEIVRGQTKSAIYLRNGKIVAASTGQKELRLGQLLYDRGLISRENLRKVLNKAGESRRPVGEVILSLGYVSLEDLREALRHQVRETVLDFFLWEEGDFQYRDCPVEFDERLSEELNAMEIMLEAARRIDEWAVMKKVIPSDTLVFKVSDQAKEHGKRIVLDTGEWRILSMLDGSKSVRDLLRETSVGEFSLYKTLYAMATSRLIQATESLAPAREGAEAEELVRLLPVYHDVIVTITKHLEEQLGREFCGKLFAGCRESLSKADQQILAAYQVTSSAEQNVKEVLAAATRVQQGTAAFTAIGIAFSQLLSCLLRQETEILGNKQTLYTIGRIRELLEVVAKYRAGEAKTRLIESILETISQVAQGLGR